MKYGYLEKTGNRMYALYSTKSAVCQRQSRRREVFRKKLLFFALTLCLILFLSLLVNTFHSKAVSEKEQKFKYYTRITIQEGDTLWNIADRFLDGEMDSRFSYISEIKNINHLHDENEIIAGKVLIVPYYSAEYK